MKQENTSRPANPTPRLRPRSGSIKPRSCSCKAQRTALGVCDYFRERVCFPAAPPEERRVGHLPFLAFVEHKRGGNTGQQRGFSRRQSISRRSGFGTCLEIPLPSEEMPKCFNESGPKTFHENPTKA